MSIPPDKMTLGPTGSGSAIGGLSAGSAEGQINVAQGAKQAQQSQAVMLPHGLLLQMIDSRVANALAAAKSAESKVVTFAKRYWPIAAGLVTAATRLIH